MIIMIIIFKIIINNKIKIKKMIIKKFNKANYLMKNK